MAQPMPESVKTMAVNIDTGTPIKGARFSIKMARDEVMILLSQYYWWSGELIAGQATMHIGLWRKSDTLPAALPLSDSPDLIWGLSDTTQFVAESLKSGGHGHVIFPRPLVLIRPPQLVGRSAVITSGAIQMRLYYLLREVSDVDLAKLMVKDHA